MYAWHKAFNGKAEAASPHRKGNCLDKPQQQLLLLKDAYTDRPSVCALLAMLVFA
jgi:hypothetical protein